MIVRQWYGESREDSLLAFLIALEVTRELNLDLQVGPWKADEVAALGFWVRGPDEAVETLAGLVGQRAQANGLRVAPADYAGATAL